MRVSDSANGPVRRTQRPSAPAVRSQLEPTNSWGRGLLEPCVSQEACTVLRGRGSGDIALLPDKRESGNVSSWVT